MVAHGDVAQKGTRRQARADDLEEGAPNEAMNDDDLVSAKDVSKLTDDEESYDDEAIPASGGLLGNWPAPPARLTKHSPRAAWTRGSSTQWDNSQGHPTPSPSNDAIAQQEHWPLFR